METRPDFRISVINRAKNEGRTVVKVFDPLLRSTKGAMAKAWDFDASDNQDPDQLFSRPQADEDSLI